MAAWIGLLVTSLNLMPVGQLDGGHGTFAVFGQRAHKLIGRFAFVAVAVMSVLGFIWHGSPSGFLYTVLLGGDVASAPSGAGANGTAGHCARRGCNHHADCLRALLRSLSDHDYLMSW